MTKSRIARSFTNPSRKVISFTGCSTEATGSLPGFTRDLRDFSANRVIAGRYIAWYLPNGKAYSATGSLKEPFDVGLEAHCASHGLIEHGIRRRTLQVPGVQIETCVYGLAPVWQWLSQMVANRPVPVQSAIAKTLDMICCFWPVVVMACAWP